MREEFIEDLVEELQGPRDGSSEVMNKNPWNEYVTGVIIPIDRSIDKQAGPDRDIEERKGPGVEEDEDETEIIIPKHNELDPRLRTKSFGITFAVNTSTPQLDICLTYGRYRSADENWSRTPSMWRDTISIENKTERKVIYSESDGEIYLYIRKITRQDDMTMVTLKVVNNLDVESAGRVAEVSLFQPSLRINLKDQTELQKLEKNQNEKMDFLYRDRPVLAKGHMCSAVWKDIDYVDIEYLPDKITWADIDHMEKNHQEISGVFKRPDVRTEFLPMYPISAPDFDWPEKEKKNPVLSTRKLSESWQKSEIEKALTPLAEGYEKWIEKNIEEMKENFPDNETAQKITSKETDAMNRIKKGIEIIKENKEARLAFCFANRCIWLQNQSSWKEKKDSFEWRPFQLAFFLMVIKSMYDEDSSDRDIVDLLWIATGGGKTEAYLAIIAFTLAYRRRRELSSHRKNRTGAGTAVMLRYTLRLLTVQQFRRMVDLITAAEYLRVRKTGNKEGWRPRECDINDRWIYGSVRFSTGLWVGSKVTPNRLLDTPSERSAVQMLGEKNSESEPAQLTRCPACGSWLRIPPDGLPEHEREIFLVIDGMSEDNEDIEDIFEKLNNDDIDETGIKEFSEKSSLISIRLKFSEKVTVDEETVEGIWSNIDEITESNVDLACFSPTRMGYFPVIQEKQGGVRTGDFEIFCPDPDCELNGDINWKEGEPSTEDGRHQKDFIEGYDERKINCVMAKGNSMPIPAYTVDQQIYYRCPSVIIGTVDKIARLPYEPKAGSIFGNVNGYSPSFGYHRDDLFPRRATSGGKKKSVEVDPFRPPELIVQDELHLINGPLGSMYGQFEFIVEKMCNERDMKPKYIASTATIKNAASQSKKLFNRQLQQFPPHGLDIEDSFFVRRKNFKEAWDEKNPGRVYMGVYAPGFGPLTPPIRIWSKLLETGYRNRDSKNSIYYWTIVGYFNAIRELGGMNAVFGQDVVERLEEISQGDNPRNIREPDKKVELSSRINSVDVPHILRDLEEGINRDLRENPHAIMATSMFGTGVDIPHLSNMVVHGQPKTTSSYLQATGRVGRKRGGLVVTFLRHGRTRDKSHYEMFPAYHHRINLDVEPVSVSPFAEGALEKGAGSVLVSCLRNSLEREISWHDEEEGPVGLLKQNGKQDAEEILEGLEKRVKEIYESEEKVKNIMNYFESQIDRWENIAEEKKSNLDFVEYIFRYHREPEKSVVLGDPSHQYYSKRSDEDIEVVFRNAPNSLRDLEETTSFGV